MKTIKIKDEAYPKKLLNIYNPPKKLYVLGDERILNEFSIAVVGARKCTKYGEEMAKSISYNLARHNVNVISGLAKGIDAFAHTGAIIGKGKTIAVLRRRIQLHISKGKYKISKRNCKKRWIDNI